MGCERENTLESELLYFHRQASFVEVLCSNYNLVCMVAGEGKEKKLGSSGSSMRPWYICFACSCPSGSLTLQRKCYVWYQLMKRGVSGRLSLLKVEGSMSETSGFSFLTLRANPPLSPRSGRRKKAEEKEQSGRRE